MKVELLLIDPQNDFCDPNGALFVPGADKDMARVAAMIDRISHKLNDIHVSMDSHQRVDIAHPAWYKDSAGRPPAPFTILSAKDLKDGKWMCANPSTYGRTVKYLEELEATNRYPHIIWPPHCLIGTWGHNVNPEINAALQRWCDRFALVDYVTKGSNPWTEHFSVFKAEVVDPADPSTQPNMRLLDTLQQADVILVAGEARSHCVANTIRDIAANVDRSTISKMVLLTDGMSDVGDPPGTTMFSDIGKAFINDMLALGASTSTTVDFLS